MKQKLADQIINDDEIDSFDGKVEILLDLSRELEDIATEALKGFKCTQRPWEYPKNHWSNRLELLLANAKVRDATYE
jgi:hypothetical protein